MEGKEEIIAYNPISPNVITLEDNKELRNFMETITNVISKFLLVVSKIDLKEQTLRNLAQLVISFISTYWGPYSQIILPMLSGVAISMFK